MCKIYKVIIYKQHLNISKLAQKKFDWRVETTIGLPIHPPLSLTLRSGGLLGNLVKEGN